MAVIRKAYLTYALNQDGHLVHVDDVPNGKDCACFCPHCNSALCAKNGGDSNVMIHHFAHLSNTDCIGAVESALHKMAKVILCDAKCVQLPNRPDGQISEKLYFDRIDVEFTDKETQLRPDCICYYGDKCLWVEFKRAHAVDAKKKGKIISAHVDCIEIDLNHCELDYEVVKKFILTSNEYRIWIRDTESKNRNSITSYSNRYDSDEDDYDYFGEYDFPYGSKTLNRTFAKDESGQIINLSSDNFDMNTHSYFCLACGKELTIDIGESNKYRFVHIDSTAHCEDDLYLYETAKEIILQKFNTDNKFILRIHQNQKCAEGSKCLFYEEEDCTIEKVFEYDLKKYNYTECNKDYRFPESRYKYDLAISRQDRPQDSIIICISAGNCYKEPPLNDNRIIILPIKNEAHLYDLMNNGINVKRTNSRGFKAESVQSASSQDIGNDVLKFSLFSSGKYYIERVNCLQMYESKRNVIIEMFYHKEIPYQDARVYSLWKCYKAHKISCYCELCFFFSRTSGYYRKPQSICRRYKTAETPHYPLETKPINCPHFRINEGLIKRIEQDYQDVNCIER